MQRSEDRLRKLAKRDGAGRTHAGESTTTSPVSEFCVDAVIRTFASRLVLVQLDDAKRGEHVHRMFGEGELDLAGALKALLECGFDGVAAVELARDAHRGPEAAREALVRLHAALGVSRE